MGALDVVSAVSSPLGAVSAGAKLIGKLGGANPNLRAQDKALADLFYYAGDPVGLQHMLDAHQGAGNPGSNTSAWLYPTATHNYVNGLLRQVVTGTSAEVGTLEALLTNVHNFKAQGYGYSPAEVTRAEQLVAAIRATPGGGSANIATPQAPQSALVQAINRIGGAAADAGATQATQEAGQQVLSRTSSGTLLAALTPAQMFGVAIVAVLVGVLILRAIRR